MKRIRSTVSGRRVIVATLALLALLAVPMVAYAAEDGPTTTDRPESVADCQELAASAELPRFTEFMDELVADNVISQAQADEIEARAREEGEYRCVAHLLFSKRSAIGATAEATDTSRRDVRRALLDGDSLAGYAAEHGVADVDLVAEIMTGPETRAAEMVSNGELSQEEADELLAEVESYVNDLVHAEGMRAFVRLRW